MGFKDIDTAKEYHQQYYEEVTKKKRKGESSKIQWSGRKWKNRTHNNSFYERVMELAMEKNLSHKELADATDIPDVTLRNYLSLRSSTIPIAAFYRLSSTLGISMEELYKYYQTACDQRNYSGEIPETDSE